MQQVKKRWVGVNSRCKGQWGIQVFWGRKAVQSIALRLVCSLLLGTFRLIVPDLIFSSTDRAQAPWERKGNKISESQWDRVEEDVKKGYSHFSQNSPHKWLFVCHQGEDTDSETERLAYDFSVVWEDFLSAISFLGVYTRKLAEHDTLHEPKWWDYMVLRTNTKTEYTDFLFCHME